MIIKGLVAILIFFVMPILLGFFVLRFWEKEKNNLFLGIILGYLFEFGILEIISVAMIFSETEFTTLFTSYMILVSVICIVSFLLNIKRVKEIYNETKAKIKDMPKVLTILFICLLLLQIFVFVKYVHIDDDDAYYVGTATTTVYTNTLYKYSAIIGNEKANEQSILRYRLGPFPLYFAILSKALNIHPAIVAHSIIPIIFVPILYSVYYLIAEKLFKDDKKSVMIFMILISILHIWGGYSIKTNFAFLLFRIWQGKALLANFSIPTIWLLIMLAEENNFKFINYVSIFITILASNFFTTMSIAFCPIVVMLSIISREIAFFNYKKVKENEFKKIFLRLGSCLVCCVPSIILGILFVIN